MLRQIRLLVFDLDYLVFDCAALKIRAVRESLISFADAIPHDVRLPDAVDAEEGYRDFGFRWLQMLPIGLDEERLAQIQHAYKLNEQRLVMSGAGRIYSGVMELLRYGREHGASLALGADSDRDYLLAVSDRYDLDSVFEIAFCTEEFGVGSTPEMLEEIMERAEVIRSETLVLGTRPELFRAANALDLLTLGCGWGLQRHESLGEADLQAFTVAQAYPALEKADSLASRYSG